MSYYYTTDNLPSKNKDIISKDDKYDFIVDGDNVYARLRNGKYWTEVEYSFYDNLINSKLRLEESNKFQKEWWENYLKNLALKKLELKLELKLVEIPHISLMISSSEYNVQQYNIDKEKINLSVAKRLDEKYKRSEEILAELKNDKSSYDILVLELNKIHLKLKQLKLNRPVNNDKLKKEDIKIAQDNNSLYLEYDNNLFNVEDPSIWDSNNDFNISEIQKFNHDNNYAIIDKKNNTISVYDKNNDLIYQTKNISTGQSRNDYNTITYTKDGHLDYGAGNMSTPAGISVVTSIKEDYGYPSIQRQAIGGYSLGDMASSIHFGRNTNNHYKTNGCVNVDALGMLKLSELLEFGSRIYTLPEQSGSRFKYSLGSLNFIAKNPNGDSQSYSDDYNVFNDKVYRPVKITADNVNNTQLTIINEIQNNKQLLLKQFNLTSELFDSIAKLLLGVALQESKSGLALSYKLKRFIDDIGLFNFIKEDVFGNKSYNSEGLFLHKIKGDNDEIKKIYKLFGVNHDDIELFKNDTALLARAALIKLLYMYKYETKSSGSNRQLDALLRYKYGNNAKNYDYDNLYLKNVLNYSDQYKYSTDISNGDIGGTIDIKDLIRHVENVNNVGYDPETDRWYRPTDETMYDIYNIGTGIDVRYNPYIKDYIKKDEHGNDYITDDDNSKILDKSIDASKIEASKIIEDIKREYGDNFKFDNDVYNLITNIAYQFSPNKIKRSQYLLNSKTFRKIAASGDKYRMRDYIVWYYYNHKNTGDNLDDRAKQLLEYTKRIWGK